MELNTRIAGIDFKNPVWVASGTFGNGWEFDDIIDLEKVGAIITKTVTLAGREGNPPPRIVETASGLLNSIGLENKGVRAFVEDTLKKLIKLDTRVIVSIAGDANGIAECVAVLSGECSPDALELNLSCPNVRHSGTSSRLVAQDAKATEEMVRIVKKKAGCPVFAKLTPNVTDISEIAMAAEQGGADGVVLVNTYLGMAVDAAKRKPVLGNVFGGLSGPAIKPLALKAVYDTHKRVKIPVIGIGGVMTGTDIAEFMLCGAAAVQTGTANLADPVSYERILAEFRHYLSEHHIKNASELTGALEAGERTGER
ncbi:MAG: dihydroorotate dehydrogenase [Candidatus Omnitrophica bacterium]|nr:dihydroorotate dehydrogenase [Candidatus Omnitrophota bacterium]